MKDLQYFIPDDIPQEVLSYEEDLTQLGVGKAGKLGALFLLLEKNERINKTVIKEQFSKVPLFTQRALYLEESLPSMAYLYIISPSGGVLQGDRYRIDINLRKNAVAHITTQGATRLYRMNKNFATQILNIILDSNCYFEYIPDQIIPYRDSRFYQSVNINLHDTATMIYSETIVPGRMAMGEYFDYDVCYLKTIAKNHIGTLKFVDTALLEPKRNKLKRFGILEEFDMLSNMYILTPSKYIGILSERISEDLIHHKKVVGGSSILPNDSGIALRILGNTIDNIKEVIHNILKICRHEIIGAEFSGIRKN
ncbi:MAG TPA: urease accessory protein UreD [Nitrososphaeraceae archaeon]|nr:urease accessory protein UreD [Nitrososphaeraceae archaeon]